jgi:NAD(P)-dependent dehydrogenase (short-subunit alcohol dehydrogenase family)
VMDLNIKSVFFMSQAAAKHLSRRGKAARSLTLPLCSRSRAASACRLTPRPKAP